MMSARAAAFYVVLEGVDDRRRIVELRAAHDEHGAILGNSTVAGGGAWPMASGLPASGAAGLEIDGA